MREVIRSEEFRSGTCAWMRHQSRVARLQRHSSAILDVIFSQTLAMWASLCGTIMEAPVRHHE